MWYTDNRYRCWGTSELVKDNINGILLNSDANAEAIASSIEKIYMLDDNTYNNFCSEAYSTWNRDFNSIKNYENFSKMLRKKLDDKNE